MDRQDGQASETGQIDSPDGRARWTGKIDGPRLDSPWVLWLKVMGI